MNALHASENKSTFIWTRLGVALVHAGLGKGQRVFVRVGDFVDLRTESNKERYYTALGTGPYQITEIGIWRCGGLSLSVRTKKHKKYPINAEVVQYVHTMPRPLTYKEELLYFENRPEFSKLRNDPIGMHKIICEFDFLLQQGDCVTVRTNAMTYRYYTEPFLQEMYRARTFLARYLGLSTELLATIDQQ